MTSHLSRPGRLSTNKRFIPANPVKSRVRGDFFVPVGTKWVQIFILPHKNHFQFQIHWNPLNLFFYSDLFFLIPHLNPRDFWDSSLNNPSYYRGSSGSPVFQDPAQFPDTCPSTGRKTFQLPGAPWHVRSCF